MSDQVSEKKMEQRISETLKGVKPGSQEEADLSRQLAKEFGLEAMGEENGKSQVEEFFNDIDSDNQADEAATSELESELETIRSEPKYQYEREDGTVKHFDSREDYLEYKIGADANKWAAKYKELEARLNEQGKEPAQQNNQTDPRTLLFDEDILENEEWKPVVDRVTKAFEKYHALASQESQMREQKLQDALQQLQSQFGESSLRNEYGISKSQELDILEKQPTVVRESLSRLDPASRLAVLKQLGGIGEQKPSSLPRAVTPQQAHVEKSAVGNPDRDPEKALMSKFESLSNNEQLGILGQIFDQVQREN